MSARRVAYVSGTRADFGLMARTLAMIQRRPELELGVFVTGMHLSAKYGETVREIEAAGLPVVARVRTPVDETSGSAMARGIGEAILGLVSALEQWTPDVVLLLGDRGEMLAGAIAAIHLNVPVAHVHGGERSGTVDEPVRHAISKLSHYHFVATPGARERLVRMGERPEHVFVTGAPGLDGIETLVQDSREALCRDVNLDPARPVCLILFHPVLQEAAEAASQARAVVDGTLAAGAQVLALAPNADAGGDHIRDAIGAYADHPDVRIVAHLSRERFVSWMAHADAMVGNSSAGLIEAPSLGLRVVNVGSRQRLRERSGNVVDVDADRDQITRGLADVLGRPRGVWPNPYGDGQAGQRIVDLLARLPMDQSVMVKTNAY